MNLPLRWKYSEDSTKDRIIAELELQGIKYMDSVREKEKKKVL